MASSQVAGLGSGIDWQKTIDQLMEIERQPINLKQQRRQKFDSQNSAWDAISGKLVGLQNTLLSMDTMKEMMIKSTSSTDTDIITATADENATTGNYAIEVKQLANAHKVISTGFATMGGTIFSVGGTFTIEGSSGHETPPQPAISFDVTTETTLSDLKRKINANSECDVTASIMNDGDPTSPYRLILTSKKTGLNSEITIGGTATLGAEFKDIAIADAVAGTANAAATVMESKGNIYSGLDDEFTFSVTSPGTGIIGTDAIAIEVKNSAGAVISTINLDGTYTGTDIDVGNGMFVSFNTGDTLTLADTFTVNTTEPTAKNAIIEIENIPITKESNTITDVIEGVTLTLKDLTTTTPINISITNDNEGVKKIVNQFIGDYNTVINTVKGYQKWDDQLKQGGALFGDGQAGTIIQDLGMLISSTNEGMNPDQLYQTLGQIGIKIGVDGKLSMDNTKFTKSLNENFEETIRLFTVDSTVSGTDKDKFLVTSNTSYTHGGDYAVNVTVVGGKVTAATIGGEAMDISSNFITGKKGTQAEGLMISVDATTDGTFTSNIRFSAGKNQELITQIQQYIQTESADGQDGLLPSSKTSVNKSIENINKQIATMEEKLVRTRNIMEKKWLAMEKYVTQMKNQSSQNNAMTG